MLHEANKTKDAVVQWIRDYFLQYAPDRLAVIGISGGKDSSVTAALCTEALGRERVVGVTMPDGIQSDIHDSYLLLDHLGIRHISINIQSAATALEKELLTNCAVSFPNEQECLPRQAKINLPARIRMTALYAVAQMLPSGGLVVNTCNRSEDYVGYSTKYGDAAGDLGPLAEFTVREVLQLGKALGLPEQLIYKTPSDGLSGLSDEENLSFSYEVLDDYIEQGICPDPTIREKITRLHKQNLHKLQPIPRCPNPESSKK